MAEALGLPGPMPTTTAVFCKTMFAFASFDVLYFEAFHTYLPGSLVKQVPYGLPHSMHSMKALHSVSSKDLKSADKTKCL